MHAVDRENTIVTHDSGSPREQMVAFWECLFPGGYLGWGKTTQLGHGLGLIMGAKLANPDKLCINVMGDASIGMVGMDIETAARNRIGILTIVFNNGVMAGEQNGMVAARSTGRRTLVATTARSRVRSALGQGASRSRMHSCRPCSRRSRRRNPARQQSSNAWQSRTSSTPAIERR
jgi:acetolactate synthase-1/2/3 large subunit